MATQSSILALSISWAEEPGRLQSKGSQRVRHNRGLSTIRKQNEISLDVGAKSLIPLVVV